MPHFEHITVLRVVAGVKDDVPTGVVIGVRTISSRSGSGRRVTRGCVTCVAVGGGADVHAVDDIDPEVPANINFLLASE